MTKKTIASIVVMPFIFGGVLVYSLYEPRIEYVREYVAAPTLEEIIEQRIADTIASSEFQNEVNAIARARVLYALSVERQEVAVELSDLAMQSFRVSEGFSEAWVNEAMNHDQ